MAQKYTGYPQADERKPAPAKDGDQSLVQRWGKALQRPIPRGQVQDRFQVWVRQERGYKKEQTEGQAKRSQSQR